MPSKSSSKHDGPDGSERTYSIITSIPIINSEHFTKKENKHTAEHERHSSLEQLHTRTSQEKPSAPTPSSPQEHNTLAPLPPPPDGGLVAWTQAFLGFLVVFITWGYMTSFGVFQTYYTNTLHHNPSSIAWIGSVQIFLVFFVGAFSGRALDAGFFRPLFVSGVFVLLVGVFMSSLAGSYWQLFLAQGVCVGFGNGMLFTPALGLVATYFKKWRSVVLALNACGGAVGGMVYPVLVQKLLPRIGFGWTVRVMGFLMMGIAAVLIAGLRTRLPPRKGGPLVEWAAFKEAPYTLFIIGMFFNWWALYFAFYYIGAYGRNIIHIPYSTSIDLLILTNGLGALGRVIPALLADLKFGPLNCIIPSALSTAALMYAWIAIRSTQSVWVFAVLDGLLSNGVQGLWPATLASLTDDVTKTGTRLGMGFTVVSFACLTGPPFGGWLIQLHGGEYLYAQIWAGTAFLVGGGGLIAARVAKTGWRLRCKV